MQKKKKSGSGSNEANGWPTAVRDIVVAAIDRGQLPVLFFGVVLMIIAWKLPENEAAQLLHEFISGLSNHSLIGWGFSAVCITSWRIHTKILRKEFGSECQRIGREKSLLQNKMSGGIFPSSEQS